MSKRIIRLHKTLIGNKCGRPNEKKKERQKEGQLHLLVVYKISDQPLTTVFFLNCNNEGNSVWIFSRNYTRKKAPNSSLQGFISCSVAVCRILKQITAKMRLNKACNFLFICIRIGLQEVCFFINMNASKPATKYFHCYLILWSKCWPHIYSA